MSITVSTISSEASVKEVDVSFYGTVYNSAKYIRKSLTSIAESALELKRYGISSEIVIVDNFSSDGTWEIMNHLKKLYAERNLEIRLIRYRCSRGLGRDIALRFTRGKYLFFISDFDAEYDKYGLVKIIIGYIKNLKNTCLYIFLTPKTAILNAGGIHDLNRTEDIELGARLIRHYIMLPVLDENFRALPFSTFMKSLDNYKAKPSFFISTYFSERRYEKGLKNYIKREFKNKIDMICGMGYTWRKIFCEAIRLHGSRNNLKLLIWIMYHMTFYIMTKLFRRRIYSYSSSINNGSLCDIAMFLNYVTFMIMLAKTGKATLNNIKQSLKNLLQDRSKAKVIQYYLALYPEALQRALKGYYFMMYLR